MMKQLKKQGIKQALAVLLLGLMVMLGTVSPIQAANDDVAPAKNITLTIGEGDMLVDDKTVPIDGAVPVSNNGRVFIPLRAVAEAFGAEVDFDINTYDITITSGKTTVVMNTHASLYTVNGELGWMDIAPYVNEDERTMVPVRFVSNALGYEVDLKEDNATIVITNKNAK
jgi:hypothetical protein